MKKHHKHILGLLLLAAIALGIFIFMAIMVGFLTAVGVIAISLALTILLDYAFQLIQSEDDDL